MSDINAINADLPSLIDELTNTPDTITNACQACIDSSENTDELKDKLTVLKESIPNTNSVEPIRNLLSMINNNQSLDEIKSNFNP